MATMVVGMFKVAVEGNCSSDVGDGGDDDSGGGNNCGGISGCTCGAGRCG